MQMAVSMAVTMAAMVMPRSADELRAVRLSTYKPDTRPARRRLTLNRRTKRRMLASQAARVRIDDGDRPKLLKACGHNARVRGH